MRSSNQNRAKIPSAERLETGGEQRARSKYKKRASDRKNARDRKYMTACRCLLLGYAATPTYLSASA